MTYPAGMLAQTLTGKPLVAHIHATEYDRSGENINEQVAAIERAGLLAADLVVAVSRLTRKTVIERYGVPPEKVVVVYNAVARHEVERRYEIPPRIRHEKRVLFLGRVTFQKGPEYFMEAARLVLQKIPNARFFMAGSGDMLPQLIRRAGQLRIGHRFHFAGFLRGEQVDRMFALSDRSCPSGTACWKPSRATAWWSAWCSRTSRAAKRTWWPSTACSSSSARCPTPLS